MLKKISIFILVFAFIIFGIFPKENFCYVKEVLSPLEIVLDNGSIFNLNGVETFDSSFTERNKKLAEKFGLSEEEAFILGNLARYWSKNILEGRQVKLVKNNLIYYRYGYYEKFENTPFCIKDGKINNKSAFDKQVKSIRRAKFMVLDMDSDTYYHPDDPKVRSLNNFIVLRKSHLSKIFLQKNKEIFSLKLELSDIKILVSDFTRNLKPDRKCSDAICREILSNINNAQKTIDIAIYGYSSVPSVEKAILNAKNRGVKIRLVYDVDRKNENIYPDTFSLVKLIPDSMSDRNSQGVSSTMHDKFYIFDDKVVITGSANLSHTDMSGYNSNSIVVINSSEAALIYKREFEQMYSGKFHSDKISYYPQKFKNMQMKMA